MGHIPGQIAVGDPALSRDQALSRAASQPQPLADSVIFAISKANYFHCFHQGKFCLQMFLTFSEFLPETGVHSFLSGAITICPNSLNESFYLLSVGMVRKKQQRLKTDYCLLMFD